jgi:hypothetical protein
MSDLKRQPRVDVLPEEVKVLCNVAICETALKFERRFVGGRHRWVGRPLKEPDEEPRLLDLEELPNFYENEKLALDLFRRFAMDMDLVPRLRIDNREFPGEPKIAAHCDLFAREPDHASANGYRLKRLAGGSGTNLSQAIAAAAVDAYNIPMKKLHRELFPGRYLVAVK